MTHQTHMLGWRVQQPWYAAVGRLGDRIGFGFVAAGIACAVLGARRCAEPAVGHCRRAGSTTPRTCCAPPAAWRGPGETADSRRPLQQRDVGFVETPRGPVNGYVANRSSSGTKTNTPIMETPQAVSVIGADQIRDQKPNKLDEVLRYTAGVRAGTFGADTRNDWCLIRGFKSDDIGLFLDGMQLFYTSYASWKLQPSNIERVEVLRGPSAVLYGGIEPERHRQRHQQDAADRAAPLYRDRRQQFRQRLCWLRFRRAGRDAAPGWQAVLPRRRPGPERRHPGQLHARQQLLHRAVLHMEAGYRHDFHGSGVGLEAATPAASTSCPIRAR